MVVTVSDLLHEATSARKQAHADHRQAQRSEHTTDPCVVDDPCLQEGRLWRNTELLQLLQRNCRMNHVAMLPDRNVGTYKEAFAVYQGVCNDVVPSIRCMAKIAHKTRRSPMQFERDANKSLLNHQNYGHSEHPADVRPPYAALEPLFCCTFHNPSRAGCCSCRSGARREEMHVLESQQCRNSIR